MNALLQNRSYINGQWVAATDYSVYNVTDPANGEILAAVADCTANEIDLAINAAYRQGKDWAGQTGATRSKLLRQWHTLVVAHRDELAQIITAESGKPLSEAYAEIDYGCAYIEWFAEEAKRVDGDVIAPTTKSKRMMVIRQPVGVVAAITPWNFPFAMITRKVAPALAAGCTIIVKPSEITPLTALALASLAEKAGFPEGVLNVVSTTRGEEAGTIFCRSKIVKKISFTGSTRVGKILYAQCADSVKRLSLELGGNAPFIVFADAELDKATAAAVASRYRNGGQTCVCANRFLIHNSIYDDFANRLKMRISCLKMGNSKEKDIEIATLISIQAVWRVKSLVEEAVQQGATVLTGGYAVNDRLYAPTVLINVLPSMRIAQEEIFGPVSTLIRFDTEEEALSIANETPYGLAAYFFTNDIRRTWRVAEALQYGMIGVNEGLISSEVAPFGGIKESGLGREGSKYGIDEYLERKYICYGI